MINGHNGYQLVDKPAEVQSPEFPNARLRSSAYRPPSAVIKARTDILASHSLPVHFGIHKFHKFHKFQKFPAGPAEETIR